MGYLSKKYLLNICKVIFIVKIAYTPALVTEITASDILRCLAKAFTILVTKLDSKLASLLIRDSYDICFAITILIADIK